MKKQQITTGSNADRRQQTKKTRWSYLQDEIATWNAEPVGPLFFDMLLPPSSLCSPSRAFCHSSVHWKVFSWGAWGHLLIACDMLTWLLWLTWLQTYSHCWPDQCWRAFPHRPNVSSWRDLPACFFPSLWPVTWYCRVLNTMAAWCMLFIWSLEPKLYNGSLIRLTALSYSIVVVSVRVWGAQ